MMPSAPAAPFPPSAASGGPQLSIWPALTTVVVATLTATVLLMFLVAAAMLVATRRREAAEAAAEAAARERAEAAEASARSSLSAAARSRLPLPPLVEAPAGCRRVIQPDRKTALALPEEMEIV